MHVFECRIYHYQWVNENKLTSSWEKLYQKYDFQMKLMMGDKGIITEMNRPISQIP